MSDEMDLELKELYDFINEEDDFEIDDDVREAAEEMSEIFEPAFADYVKERLDIPTLLREDDELLEQLVDKISYINLYEISEEADLEGTEGLYTSLIDTCIELSKTIDPMTGFGRDRLEAALSIIAGFEKENWPLMTLITPGNASVFQDMIPEEHYDDIIIGRKRAMGAIRLSDEKSCAAGVIVYHIEENEEVNVRLDWIYVSQDFREMGIGNMMMAKLIEFTLDIDEAAIFLSVDAPRLSDDESKEEFAVLTNFFDSWRFDFSMSIGRKFFIKVSDQDDNSHLKGSVSGVQSLNALGGDGKKLVSAFFKKLDNDYDESIITAPYSFFDPEVSCAIVENGEIKALLLLHRFSYGDYRYEALRSLPGYDPSSVLKLFRFAYQIILKNKDVKSTIFGTFESEEGRDLVNRVFPDGITTMQFAGYLAQSHPEDIVTSEDWEEL